MHGNAWKCLEMLGNEWRCMEMHGNAWKCLEMNGDAWRCMEMHGNADWKCKENVWKAFEILRQWRLKQPLNRCCHVVEATAALAFAVGQLGLAGPNLRQSLITSGFGARSTT